MWTQIEYTLPIFDWLKSYSECSSECWGNQRIEYGCYEYDRELGESLIVSDWHCEGSANTPSSRLHRRGQQACNTHCRHKWVAIATVASDQCPVRCGAAQVPAVARCATVDSANGTIMRFVQNSSCGVLPANFNATAECVGQCLPVSYVYGPWSDCSHECQSRRSRSFSCVDLAGRRWSEDQCWHLGPPQIYASSDCDGFAYCANWSVSSWSEVSDNLS